MTARFLYMKKLQKEHSFNRKMRILSFMIRQARPVNPSEIKKGTNLTFPCINYHLNTLCRLGVVIPLFGEDNKYCVQPFMVEPIRGQIDGLLQKAVDTAFDQYTTYFRVEPDQEMKLRLKTFRNAFLIYVNYLLDTGDFSGSKPLEV